MSGKKKKHPAAPKAQVPTAQQAFPRELKTALRIALPLGAIAALVVLWPTLFPVAPEQLVEVAWTHRCGCAHGWIKSLRAGGFTVRDYELDDTRTQRQRWQVPDSIRGCHPASYLGYFLDGHISANTLRRLAREHPQALGVQQVDTLKPGEDGKPKIVGSRLLLIGSSGVAAPWFAEGEIEAPHSP